MDNLHYDPFHLIFLSEHRRYEFIKVLSGNDISVRVMPITYDSIWGFKEDILELRRSFREHVWEAHLSQPFGIPLHRYRGQLTLDAARLLLSGKDKDTNEPLEIVISREKIVEIYLGWDDVLRRWRDTRAWIRPLRVTFQENEESKTLYI